MTELIHTAVTISSWNTLRLGIYTLPLQRPRLWNFTKRLCLHFSLFGVCRSHVYPCGTHPYCSETVSGRFVFVSIYTLVTLRTQVWTMHLQTIKVLVLFPNPSSLNKLRHYTDSWHFYFSTVLMLSATAWLIQQKDNKAQINSPINHGCHCWIQWCVGLWLLFFQNKNWILK